MLLFSVLVFASVSLGLTGMFIWLAPARARQRLLAMSEPVDRSSQWRETVVKIVGPFAQLSSPTGEGDASPLRLKFLNAGIRHEDAQLVYFGLKTLLPLLFAGGAALALRAGGSAVDMKFAFYLIVAALL